MPGELHWVVQRGHNRQAVFIDDEDRRLYIDALREAARQHGLAIHGYALLTDQVQLLATPLRAESLGKTIQAVGRKYVPAFNKRHHRSGTLWEGRFQAALIEAERYGLSSLLLLEQAPVEAGLAVAAEAWPWSSAAHHLGQRGDALTTDHPLYWRLGNTPFDREANYRRLLDAGVSAADRAALDPNRIKSWAIGDEAFLARLAERTPRPLTMRQRGRPKRHSSVPNKS